MNIDKWKKKPTKKELIDIIKNQEEVISELHEVHKHFLKLLDSKDNIIKEVREYIEKASDNEYSYGDYEIHYEVKKELLEILDKVGDDKE